jgi:excisionase family DNA binding protein
MQFTDRITCTVAEACEVSGLGRTKIYEAIADGRLVSTRVDKRRLILVASLQKMLTPQDVNQRDEHSARSDACNSKTKTMADSL